MDFIGTGNRVSAGDIQSAAHLLGCDEAAVRAVLDVECKGSGFDRKNRPTALFEPHKFYAYLGNTPKRALAVAQGLAYAKWKPGNYPKTIDGIWSQIERACKIDEEAALRACSWGLGQILGDYYDEAGYDSPQAFVQANMSGEGEQLRLMVKLVQHWNLADELQRLDWRGFARGWNGPGYEKNAYHTKLAKAFEDHGGVVSTHKAEKPVLAKLGSKGPVVRAVQEKLNLLGFHSQVDGDFGNETKRQVRLFQLDKGLKGDGIVGPVTWSFLENATPLKPEPARQDATVKDLKETSTIVAKTDVAVNTAKVAGVTTAAAGAAKETGLLDHAQALAAQASTVSDQAQQVGTAASTVASSAGEIKSAVVAASPILELVSTYWWLVAVVGFLVVAFLGHDILKARLADHQSGKTT